jgi:hypothetical protein
VKPEEQCSRKLGLADCKQVRRNVDREFAVYALRGRMKPYIEM